MLLPFPVSPSHALLSFTALQILTRDSVTISVDGVVYYRVYDPLGAEINIQDIR